MHHGKFAFDEGGAAASNCPIVVPGGRPAPSRAANSYVAVPALAHESSPLWSGDIHSQRRTCYHFIPLLLQTAPKALRCTLNRRPSFLSRGPLSPFSFLSFPTESRMRGYEMSFHGPDSGGRFLSEHATAEEDVHLARHGRNCELELLELHRWRYSEQRYTRRADRTATRVSSVTKR